MPRNNEKYYFLKGLTTAYNMAVLAGINLLTLSIGLYKYRRV